MAETYAEFRQDLVSRITAMYVTIGRVSDEFYDLYGDLTNEGNPNSGLEAYSLYTTNNALQQSWGGGTSTFPGRLLSLLDYLNDNIGGGEVDMASILTAMLAATPDEIQQFIGIVDAFRVSIWNRPYNEDFYAALARGFTQW